MAQKKKTSEKNGVRSTDVNGVQSVWSKALTTSSHWPDKDEFLDVVYWSRQVLGIVLGITWGIIPLKGFIGIALFAAINAGLLYTYTTMFQKVDEDEFGGTWEITKEGFMTSFAGFLVVWIIIYSGLYND